MKPPSENKKVKLKDKYFEKNKKETQDHSQRKLLRTWLKNGSEKLGIESNGGAMERTKRKEDFKKKKEWFDSGGENPMVISKEDIERERKEKWIQEMKQKFEKMESKEEMSDSRFPRNGVKVEEKKEKLKVEKQKHNRKVSQIQNKEKEEQFKQD